MKKPVMMSDIFKAIERERAYQDDKWGTIEDNPHSVISWLRLMDEEITEAAGAVADGKEEAMREVLQAIAVGVACLEQHGLYERDYEATT